MATEVLLYLVIVLLIMQVVFLCAEKMVNLWKKDFWSSLKQ